MLRKLLSVFGFIVALIVWILIGQLGREIGRDAGEAVFTPSKSNQQELEENLIEGFEEAARQVNATLPIMIDDDTRMDKATVGPGALVTYHYTFPKYSSKEIDPNWIRQDLRVTVKNDVCASTEMKPSLQLGGAYAFSYSGRDGVKIATFQVNGNDCGFSELTSSPQSFLTHNEPSHQTDQPSGATASPQLTTQQIKRMQTLFTQLGYHPGPIDGDVGPRTRQAISDFQRHNSLPRTGEPSQQLLSLLESRVSRVALDNTENSDCVFKSVMSDADYRACGVNPPSSQY
ncbi:MULTISPECIES: peptidoglycan-binding protein [unclassified Thiocapsa]|uniref:peptidoglycan-binding protein n=1 Tax=unclassified Thiocapsa TaxID=2641286 RepID=UPI0035AFAD4E